MIETWLFPGVFFLASASAFWSPQHSFAIILGVVGVVLSPLNIYLLPVLKKFLGSTTGFVAKITSEVASRSIQEFLTNEDQNAQLMDIVGAASRRALTHPEVLAATKAVLLDSMGDEQLQAQLVTTVKRASVDASRDQEFQIAMVSVTKEAVTKALNDQGFMKEMVSTISRSCLETARNQEISRALIDIVKKGISDATSDKRFMDDMLQVLSGAVVDASQDTVLRNALLGVTKEAVTEALKDEDFIKAVRDALCDGLKDTNIYRSAAAGVVNSLNPFAAKG